MQKIDAQEPPCSHTDINSQSCQNKHLASEISAKQKNLSALADKSVSNTDQYIH